MDDGLTRRLLDGTLDLLADHGLSKLTADALAAHSGAGKAAIYRRWSKASDIAVAAVRSCVLVPPAADTGSLRDDLVVVFEPWTRPLDRDELAAAALLSQARYDPEMRRALDTAVVQPLAGVLTTLIGRRADLRDTLPATQEQLLRSMVQSLWWDRFVTHRPASTPSDVAHLVDRVLVPLLH